MCNKAEHAEQAAIFLEKKWGDYLHENYEFHLEYLLEPESQKYYLHEVDIENWFNTGDATKEEVRDAIKSMANNKSSGIDN